MKKTQINTTKMLIPSYLKEFSCVGPACEDNCCSGFQVPIDAASYKKYQDVEEPELKKLIEKNVKLNQNSENDIDYAKIDASKGCVFLDNQSLCSIHKTLGEEYLSMTCSKYPKQINLVNKNLEKSATLSCPEIARLVLLNKNGIEFEESMEEIDSRDYALRQLQTSTLPMTEHFHSLREFTLNILKNRDFSIEKRLIILDNFYHDLKLIIENNAEDGIPLLIEEYNLYQNKVKDRLLNFNELNLVKKSIELGTRVTNFGNRYKECLQEMIEGLSYHDNQTEDELIDELKIAKENYYLPFMSENEYILENYLVNYVYKYLFPFSFGQDVYEAFLMLLTHIKTIELHLIGIAKRNKELSLNMTLKLIQCWSKDAEHDLYYMMKLFEAVK